MVAGSEIETLRSSRLPLYPALQNVQALAARPVTVPAILTGTFYFGGPVVTVRKARPYSSARGACVHCTRVVEVAQRTREAGSGTWKDRLHRRRRRGSFPAFYWTLNDFVAAGLSSRVTST